jgi:hypothetical protein
MLTHSECCRLEDSFLNAHSYYLSMDRQHSASISMFEFHDVHRYVLDFRITVTEVDIIIFHLLCLQGREAAGSMQH